MTGPPWVKFPDDDGGSFLRRAHMKPTIHSSTSYLDLQGARRLVKEGEHESQAYLDCMFGTMPARHCGSGTKVHVLPKRLGQTTSSGLFRNEQPSSSAASNQISSRLLITRLVAQQESSEESSPTGPLHSQLLSQTLPKDRSLAVGLLISIPKTSVDCLAANRGRRKDEPVSPSSFISADNRFNRFPLLPHSGVSSAAHSRPATRDAFLNDDNSGSAIVMERWSTILEVLDDLHANLAATGGISLHDGGGLGSPTSPQSNSATALNPKTLRRASSQTQHEASVNETEMLAVRLSKLSLTAKARLSQAFAIHYVLPACNCWGAWREEAKWLVRWSRHVERVGFLSTALTAFFATHSTWVELLGNSHANSISLKDLHATKPSSRRPRQQRTIVVSKDRMAARRFIFLLAIFLGPRGGDESSLDEASFGSGNSQALFPSEISAFPTRTSSDHDGLGLSPKTSTPSLSHSTSSGQSLFPRSQSSRLTRAINVPAMEARKNANRYQNPASSLNSPPFSHFGTPQTTVDVSLSTPIPHFSSTEDNSPQPSFSDESYMHRRRSSAASTQLMRSLQLTSPKGKLPSQSDERHRFGSKTASREDRLGNDDANQTSITPPNIDTPRVRPQMQPRTDDSDGARLDMMTDDLYISSSGLQPGFELESTPPVSSQPAFEYSLNEDGVVDVKIPALEKPSEHNSGGPPTIARSGSQRCARGAVNPRIRQKTSDNQALIAGYLPFFHQDVSLQAVKPYTRLLGDVKHATAPKGTSPDSWQSWPLDKAPKPFHKRCSSTIIDPDAGTVRVLTWFQSQRWEQPSQREENDAVGLTETIVSEPDQSIAIAIDKMLQAGDHSPRTPSLPSSASSSFHDAFGLHGSQDRCRDTIMGALRSVIQRATSRLEEREQETDSPQVEERPVARDWAAFERERGKESYLVTAVQEFLSVR